MGVLDGELFGKSGLINASGVGIGVQFAFISAESERRDQSFGIGLAYMRDSTTRRLRDDFVVGEPAPEGATQVEYADTYSDAVVLVVTYSFGTRRNVESDDVP